MKDFNKKTAYQYFLGSLNESDREAIEERLFTDEEYSSFLDNAEADLIDEYLRDELEASEKNLFNKNYLISENRREKVLAAKILQERLFENRLRHDSAAVNEEKTSLWSSLLNLFSIPQFAVASLAVLLVAFGVWFLIKDRNPVEIAGTNTNNKNFENKNASSAAPVNTEAVNSNSSLNNQNANNNSATEADNRNQKSDTNLNANQRTKENPANSNKPVNEQKEEKREEKNAASQPAFLALSLFPATRSSSSKSLNLKPNIQAVNLQINNDRTEDVDLFRVEVFNGEDANILTLDYKNTNYRRKSFPVQIPAKSLGTGDYRIVLSGADTGGQFQPLNYFYFSVEK